MQKEKTVVDEFGYKEVQEANERIGKFLGYTPEIEYCVGTKDSICFSPSHMHRMLALEQKHECEKFLEEQRTRFPDGWVIKEGNTIQKLEWYPNFNTDWNMLMSAIKRLQDKGVYFEIPVDINKCWKLLSDNCIKKV